MAEPGRRQLVLVLFPKLWSFDILLPPFALKILFSQESGEDISWVIKLQL